MRLISTKGRWDRAKLERHVNDNAEQPDTTHDGVEELVRPVDGHCLAVGGQKGESDDLVGEAAVAPGILAIDVGADGAGDTGVRFGRAGGEGEQAVMDSLVDIDESRAGLDGDLRGRLVELEDPVHGAHVKQGVAVVERKIPVAAPGPPRADGHAVLSAVGQRLAALFDRRWAGDKGPRSDGANQ